MMNKKGQIGDLMSNYVMTIVIIVILIVFGLSNTLLKVSSSNDNKLSTLEFEIETYESLFSKYINYVFKNKDKEIDCDINELIINRIDSREYKGNLIDFKEENNMIFVKDVLFEWEELSCPAGDRDFNYYKLSNKIFYSCCPDNNDINSCNVTFCTSSNYKNMFDEMCGSFNDITNKHNKPLEYFVNQYKELFLNEKYNC